MSDHEKKQNPGWAGETGEFGHLDEADVRGSAYVGTRPRDGGHPGAAASYPYMRIERTPDAPLFEGEYAERLEKILSRYPNRQAALLPVLNLVQEIRGHVSPDAMSAVADVLGLSPAYVRGVATFYTMYNKRPVGRHLIQVCTNVGCSLCGADDVLAAFLEHTGTEQGETSEDGEFTVVEVECLGACGFPTVVQINDRYFESVASEDVPAILERLRTESANGARSAPPATPGDTERDADRDTDAGAANSARAADAAGSDASSDADSDPRPGPRPSPDDGPEKREEA